MNKVRLRATLTVDYEANTEDYGTDDPLEMAAIDQKSFREDLGALLFVGEANDTALRVEALTE
jgi:hypothetical protein